MDTHALLWFLDGDTQLSGVARSTMEDGGEVLLVSAACLWEIAIKTSLGRLEAPDDLPTLVREQRFDFLNVSSEHAWEARRLPIVPGHKDPFDRLLVTQALVEELPIISADPKLDAYPIQRHW